MQPNNNGNNNVQDLSKEVDIRKNKIKILKEMNINPYAEKFDCSHSILEARNLQDGDEVTLAGRMTFRRMFGKFCFVQIADIYAKIQVSLSVNQIELESYQFFKDYVDIGDFVGFSGTIYHTQTGELTVQAQSYKLLSKAMLPLPEKYHGLTDIELRYRQRYLDLIANEDARKVFLGRSKIESIIRRYLEDLNFIEIETPVLQTAVSGASAKPFFTHHNALDMECNLRIAKETWLKQAIAGGIPRVFELGKDFRNEGIDATHLQEFTQVEWYASYWDFEKNIKVFKDLVQKLLKETLGTMQINYQGKVVDFGKENWERINYVEEMTKIVGFDFLDIDDLELFKNKVVEKGLFSMKELDECKSVRTLIDFIYKRKIRENIVGPVILYNYPAVLKTLARRNDHDSRITDVFQVVVCGAEICNAYSELVDPIIQRETLMQQLEEKANGDEETMDLDEAFLLSMEHGMPPMSGLGFGIDRFIMIIYDLPNIKDTVLFPIMK